MSEIVPHENDILLGRGGKNNQHVGNEQLRAIARSQRDNYRMSSKKGKSYISRQVVAHIRQLSPPGRFLKKNAVTGQWEDVGDEVAREKASQALRDAVSAYMSSKTTSGSDDTLRDELHSSEHRRASSAPASVLAERSSSFAAATSEYNDRWRYSTPKKAAGTPDTAPLTPDEFLHPSNLNEDYSSAFHPAQIFEQEYHHHQPSARYQVQREATSGFRGTHSDNYYTKEISEGRYYSSTDIVAEDSMDLSDDFDLFDGGLLKNDSVGKATKIEQDVQSSTY